MNIKEAKTEILNTIKAYLVRNEQGEYAVPAVRQRPILLMGPPGIGKTAIVEQAAAEAGISLVSYTITHHTRQSAVGLPFITEKEFDGKKYQITEYTMSEIIAAVYEKIEATGIKEGILFIDEINCVSETLAPTMLQFLQAKTFGSHKVPEGYIIVAAGNPPEYNKSVHEFDIVTLDRVKRIDIEEDFAVWKEYAYNQGIHGTITAFLELKKQNFYHVETTIDGKQFVTARGWQDLSEVIRIYEKLGIAVTEELILQYVQHPGIAKEFAAYYELYMKYREVYQIEEVLKGNISEKIVNELSEVPFDERITIMALILDRLDENFRKCTFDEKKFKLVYETMLSLNTINTGTLTQEQAERKVQNLKQEYELKKQEKLLLHDDELAMKAACDMLEKIYDEARLSENKDLYEAMKQKFNQQNETRGQYVDETGKMLNAAFDFIDKLWHKDQEMVIFMSELTMNSHSMEFILENGCDRYYEYNKMFMFDDRRKEILSSKVYL